MHLITTPDPCMTLSRPAPTRWLGRSTRALGPRQAAERPGPEPTWELGPPGLLPVTGPLALHTLGTALVLPLGILGVAAATWSDWPLPLRLICGLAGLFGGALSALATLWPLLYAAGLREQLVIADGLVTHRRGLPPLLSRTRRLGPVDGLHARVAERPERAIDYLLTPSRRDFRFGYCVELVRSKQVVARLGTWLDHRLASTLVERIEAHLQPGSAPAPLDELPTQRPVRDPWGLALDLGIGLALFAFNTWPGALTALEAAYPFAVLLFFATLPLWLATRRPGHGLDAGLDRPLAIAFGLALSGVVLLTSIAFVPLLPDSWLGADHSLSIWHIGICLVIFATISIWTGRRALRDRLPRPPARMPSSVLDAALFVSLLVLTGVHESWAWLWVEDSQRHLGPLSIAMLPVAAALLVWPGRFFYQLEQPFSDGPRWRFVGLLAMFTAYGLFGALV